MSWHYQIRKQIDKGQPIYDIVERYTGTDGHTKRIAPYGESPLELVTDLQRMLNDAVSYPILDDPEPDGD